MRFRLSCSIRAFVVVAVVAVFGALPGCSSSRSASVSDDSDGSSTTSTSDPTPIDQETSEPPPGPDSDSEDPFSNARVAASSITLDSGDVLEVMVFLGEPQKVEDVEDNTMSDCFLVNERAVLVPYRIKMMVTSSMSMPVANASFRLSGTSEGSSTAWRTDTASEYGSGCDGVNLVHNFYDLQPEMAQFASGYIAGIDYFSPNAPDGEPGASAVLETATSAFEGTAVCEGKISVLAC